MHGDAHPQAVLLEHVCITLYTEEHTLTYTLPFTNNQAGKWALTYSHI